MSKLHFIFNVPGDRTMYTYKEGRTSFYDCGWEYGSPVSETDAKSYLDNGRWVLLENMNKTVYESKANEANEAGASRYPDNFSFTHDTTSQMYDMVKLLHPDLWGCSMHGDTFGEDVTGATYTDDEIAEHFAKGHWKEVSKADKLVEDAPKERELVFPFTYKHAGDSTAHTVTKDAQGTLLWLEDYPKVWVDLFTESELREDIKSGEIIVISVGPQATATQEPVETPTNPSADNTALDLQTKIEGLLEATERLNRLAQAVEAVNISLEAFKTVFADVQDMIGNNRQFEMQAFCCEEK